MNRVVFKLSMPNKGSWNGQWSGESCNYIISKTITDKKLSELGLANTTEASWYYSWGDGWGASVSCRKLKLGDRLKKSDGFCGYDWMVSSILDYGKIMATHEIKAMKEKEQNDRMGKN